MERFWAKVATGEPDECWLWQASINNRGYGQFGLNYRMALAHRVAWTLTNGDIPEGMCVLHTCDVRSCVNPRHLFLGTNLQNTQDMLVKGRQRNQNSIKDDCPRCGGPYSTYTDGGRTHRLCRPCKSEDQRIKRKKAS